MRDQGITMAFKLGDIVQLKSGGPPMTVSEFFTGISGTAKKDEMWCTWFRGASKERALFEEHTLKPYEPPRKQEAND